MPRKAKQQRQSGGAEYRFRIDAYSPDTMPMARLAEYMQELALMLGEPTAVHFRRLEKGSTVVVHRIEREAVPKVRERVSAVRRGEGPREALRSYRKINALLRDDNAIGVLQDRSKTDGVLIRFPGRDLAEEKFPSVRQQGAVDGMVIRVGGQDQTVPVWLEADGKPVTGCWTDRLTAKRLGVKLFEQVRLFGRGRWSRDSDGNWTLLDFKIENFEALAEVPLSTALEALRAIPLQWGDNAYDELGVMRRGSETKGNGGH